LGDPKIPAFEKTTKIADVNALLKTLNVADYKNFPLVSAEKDKKQTVFTLAPQTNGKPEYLVSSKNNKNELNLTNNKLTLTPETGELIVNYSKKYNNYEFSYKPEPKDSLRISYKIGNLTSAEADPNSWAAPEANNKIDFSTTKLFEFLPDTPLYNADKLIDTNIGKLKDAEKAHMKAFKDFMFNLWKTEDDQNINDTELNNAKNNLAIILGEKNELVTFIETNKSDYKTVAYVMDRMKQIFALEAGYEGSTISYLRSRR
jgi:hypothetical protein